MRLRCPNCDARFSIDALLGVEAESAAARVALMRAFALSGDIGRALVRYLGLFRPDKNELSMKRVAALLDQILPDIEAGRIERAGRVWPAPHAAWIAAIEQMCAKRDTLRLPLKGHGYLHEIIAGAANRGEAAAERQVEEARRYSPTRGTAAEPAADTPARTSPSKVRDYLRNFALAQRAKEDRNEPTDR